MNLQEIREQQTTARNAIMQLRDKIADEKRDFTTDENTAWEQANADYDGLTRKADIFSRAAEVAKSIVPTAEPVADSVQKQTRSLRDQFRAAGEEGITVPLMRSGLGKQFRTSEDIRGEYRAMSTTTGSEGGNLVPSSLAQMIDIALLEFGGVREVATVIRTATGAQIDLPTVSDHGNSGRQEAENAGLDTTDVTFGTAALNAYKFSSDLVKIPYELAQDSDFDMASLLGQLLGERVARSTSTAFTVGSGSSAPQGIVTASTLGLTAAGAAAITADELTDLEFSVDRAYRRNGTYMAADATVKLIRKLKDSEGRYLWGSGNLNNGQPDTINGYRLITNNDTPAATTGLKSVIFGDMSKYWIRDAGAIRVRALTERYASEDQTAYVALMRTDGVLVNTAAVKHLIQA